MNTKQKIIVAARIGASMLPIARTARADFFDGLRIPDQFNYDIDQRMKVGNGKTEASIAPKYFGKNAWGFANFSEKGGKFNGTYAGLGPIVEGPLPMRPTLEAFISKDGRVEPYLSVYATKLFAEGKFEISPRITVDVKTGKTDYGSTVGMGVGNGVRVGIDATGGDSGNGMQLISRVNVGENKLIEAYFDPHNETVQFRLSVRF